MTHAGRCHFMCDLPTVAIGTVLFTVPVTATMTHPATGGNWICWCPRAFMITCHWRISAFKLFCLFTRFYYLTKKHLNVLDIFIYHSTVLLERNNNNRDTTKKTQLEHFENTYNFQGTHILGASRGHLCDSVASCYLFLHQWLGCGVRSKQRAKSPKPSLLLRTNRKSHVRFRLVPASMTLGDLERLKRHSCSNNQNLRRSP